MCDESKLPQLSNDDVFDTAVTEPRVCRRRPGRR